MFRHDSEQSSLNDDSDGTLQGQKKKEAEGLSPVHDILGTLVCNCGVS